MQKKISASLMCVDLLDIRGAVSGLEREGIDLIHCDMMDGHFVPNWMLFPDLVSRVGEAFSLPLDMHLMVEDPLRMLKDLPVRQGDIVSLSYESTVHIQRGLAAVRERGALPGLALNPGTPLDVIRELLPDIGMLLIMTVNPGFAGQKMVPQTLDKIARARRLLDDAGYPDTPIEVDGNCSFENVPLMVARGADIIVAGTSSLFKKGLPLHEGVRLLRAAMA